MAINHFETMPTTGALNYNAATDVVIFGHPLASASTTTVAPSVANPSQVMVTSVGHAVFFGTGILGESDFVFPDSSKLVVGTNAPEVFSGAATDDALYGWGGNDTLNGGAGHDLLSGGAGADLFVIFPGQSGVTAGATDTITGWESIDSLGFSGPGATTSNYVETTASGFAAAKALADAQIRTGAADYVVVAVGADLVVFADSRGDNGGADDAVVLLGGDLNIISAANIRDASQTPPAPDVPTQPSTPPPTSDVVPTLPAAPHNMLSIAADGFVTGNMDAGHLSDLLVATIIQATSTELLLQGPGGLGLDMIGSAFEYVNNQLVSGSVSRINFTDAVAGRVVLQLNVSLQNVPAGLFEPWLIADATQTALQTLLAGSDRIGGGANADLLRGYAGNDLVYGGGGSDTLYGGTGDDVIYAGYNGDTMGTLAQPGSTYLRGEEGDDYIIGGSGFDDANGNQGDDTISTGTGDDYAVGGKDNDLLFGGVGNDIVWGNLGNDTCDGGDGADQVRGGQGDDRVSGGNGNDFISGDRGNDTESGGAGADNFHGSQDAGIDRVLDFNLSEGDRVQLDPGTTYTVSQVGADTVLDMGGANQMILVGVQFSTVTPGWIFLG